MSDHHHHHHQSYPVMTPAQSYSHSHTGTLLDASAMNIDVDKSPHQLSQLSTPASSDSCHSSIIYSSNHVNFAATPGASPFGHQPHYGDMHQHSPPQLTDGGHALTLNPAHLRNPAVGPSRVLTRRQARAAQQQASAQMLPGDGGAHNHASHEHQLDEGFMMFPNTADPSRPQTPNRFQAGNRFTEQRSGLPDLNIGTNALNMQAAAISPPHPSTPASVSSSSGFSHYGFHPYATHSRSTSSSTHPRSTSPAISVMSAATSLSSTSSRPRPPLSSASVTSFHSTSKPKKRLINRERKDICLYYINNPNARQEDIAAHYGVERSTVSKILKHKSKWLAIPEGDDQQVAKHRPSKFPEIEAGLQEWLEQCRDTRTLISDVMIRTKAREAAREMSIGEDKFKASAGWVENFKHRHGIKKGVWIGRPEPPIIMDDDSESEGELLSDFKERQQREFDLRNAAELAQQRQNGQVGMDATGGDLSHTSQTALSEPKLSPLSTNQWPPPGPPSHEGVDMTFTDPAGTTVLSQNDAHATEMNEEERQRAAQQVALDCQPPPPYQSAIPQNGVSSEDMSNALALHMSHSGDMMQYHNQQQAQHHTQGQMQFPSNPAAAWTAGPQGVVQVPVSAQEASLALEKVFLFLKAQRPDFLTQQEHNVITDVKHMIWLSSATSANATPTAVNTVGGQGHCVPKAS